MLRHSLKLTAVILLAAATVAGGEGNGMDGARPRVARTDLAFLIDVSGSMRKRRGLVRAREVLIDVVDNVVQPGTRVAIIPFGNGVHPAQRFEVPPDEAGADRARAKIRDAIAEIRARDSYTYLYEAIYAGLDMLRVFKEAAPGNARHVVLISDGKQLVRRGESKRNLDEVLAHFERAGFRRGQDWYIWYGHFGAPDDRLSVALEDAEAGSTIALDDLPSLRWALTSVSPDQVALGRLRPGGWGKRFELVVSTNEAGIGQQVTLGLRGHFPRGMSLSVTPELARLTSRTTRIPVVVRCEGGQPGEYPNTALVVRPARGRLHWVESGAVEMPFEVARPRVDVGSRLVALGRLSPGETRKFAVALSPNESASILRPRLSIEPAGVPAAARLTVDRTRVRVSRRTEVTATLTIARDARPGDHACRLVLSGSDVEIVPEEVRIAFRIGFGRVRLGSDHVEFAPLQPGEESTREVLLIPDEETASKGVDIGVEFTDVPDGLTLSAPTTVTLRGRTRLPIQLYALPGAEAGVHTAKLRLRAPADVRVEPAEVPVTVTVGALNALWLPPVVDLGDIPATHAREVAGRLELAVSPHLEGAELRFEAAGDTAIEPRVVPLREGELLVPLRLRAPEAGLGPHEGRFKVFVVRDGTRAELEPVVFRWRVVASFVRLVDWEAPPPLPVGAADAVARIVLETSPDLAGDRARATVELRGLAEGMTVEAESHPFTLEGGLQAVRLPLHVTGARAGRYEGELRIALTAPVNGVAAVATTPVAIEVAGASVKVVSLQGSLEGLRPRAEREVLLVLKASAVPVPTTLVLEIDRGGLPAGIEADLPPAVRFSEPNGTVSVPLRFRMVRAVESGRWDVTVRARARTPGVAVAPDSVQVRASVPRTITLVRDERERMILWIAGGIGTLLLGGFVLLIRLRRGATDSGYAYYREADEESLKELLQEDEMVLLEGFEDQRH